jgi:hypothetical protein
VGDGKRARWKPTQDPHYTGSGHRHGKTHTNRYRSTPAQQRADSGHAFTRFLNGSTTLPIKVWARAFGTTRHATDASAATAVSKGLLQVYTRLKKAPLSPSRLAEVNQYNLLGAFAEPLPHAAATEAPTLEDYAAQLAAASAVPSLDDQRRKKIAR